MLFNVSYANSRSFFQVTNRDVNPLRYNIIIAVLQIFVLIRSTRDPKKTSGRSINYNHHEYFTVGN